MMDVIQHLIIDGRQLEYVWYGPAPEAAPTLVFLHEGLGCLDLWRDFPARLAGATGCGALVYSRFGYGRSDPCRLPRPIRFLHDEGQAILPDVLRLAGVRQCILVGHSDGGSIAIIYAGGMTAVPLLGLITESPHVICEEKTVTSIRSIKDVFQNGNLRRRLYKYHGENTDCAFWGWNDVWLHPDFRDWNIEEYVPRIEVPMLVIQGANDQYGTLAQVDSIRGRAKTTVEVLILPDCGHNPHQEQEAAVFQAMQDFVARIKNQAQSI
jgi:pimeloyl-ACP methyl ester carboxylesterase